MPGAAVCRGVFVTLEAAGALRGCIGRVLADRPLGEVVRDLTVAAARDDPRFTPVTRDELPEIRVELSVLSMPVPAIPVRPERLLLGRDGLLVRRGDAVGVLLPQVAVEMAWDVEAFLAAVCRKAGLAEAAWRDPETQVFTFEAEVFGE